MPNSSSNVKEKQRIDTNEPHLYEVIFLNDDFTPMDFVTLILIEIFNLNYTEAEELMMKVHLEGKARVGTYPYDIAVSKAAKATAIARNNDFPLRIIVRKTGL